MAVESLTPSRDESNREGMNRREAVQVMAAGAALPVLEQTQRALDTIASVTEGQESAEQKKQEYLRFTKLEEEFREGKITEKEYGPRLVTKVSDGAKEYKVAFLAGPETGKGKIVVELIEDKETKKKHFFFGVKLESGHAQLEFPDMPYGKSSPAIEGLTLLKPEEEEGMMTVRHWRQSGDPKERIIVDLTTEDKEPKLSKKGAENVLNPGDLETQEATGTDAVVWGRHRDGQDGKWLIGKLKFKKEKQE